MHRPAITAPALDVGAAIHVADSLLTHADTYRAEEAGDHSTETTDCCSPMHGEHEAGHDDVENPCVAQRVENDDTRATKQGDEDTES